MSTFLRLPLALLAVLGMVLLGTGTAVAETSGSSEPTTTAAPTDGAVLDSLLDEVTSSSSNSATSSSATSSSATSSSATSSSATSSSATSSSATSSSATSSSATSSSATSSSATSSSSAATSSAAPTTSNPVCDLGEEFPDIPELEDVIVDLSCSDVREALCEELESDPELADLAAELCGESSSPTTTSKAPTSSAAATTSRPAPQGVYYQNCDDARARGAAPVHADQPGYRPALDSDSDGIGCEETAAVTPVRTQTSGTSGTGKLAYTGTSAGALLPWGAALVHTGGWLLVSGRRRA
jgi:hypothetical protein